VIRFVDRSFAVWAVGGLAAAFGLGVAIGGSVEAASRRCCGVGLYACSCFTT
jgi:hypothetical protein